MFDTSFLSPVVVQCSGAPCCQVSPVLGPRQLRSAQRIYDMQHYNYQTWRDEESVSTAAGIIGTSAM